MRRITVNESQSLFDIAIQRTGSVENTYAIAQENGLEVTELLTPGQLIEIPAALPTDGRTLGYYEDNAIIPATAQLTPDIAAIIEEGDICYGGPFSEHFADPYDRNECADYEGTPIIAYDPVFSEEF